MAGTGSRGKRAAAGAIALAMLPLPAAAQATRDEVLDALVACGRIADVMARVACYDSNIGKVPARAAPPPPVAQRAAPSGDIARGAPAAPVPAARAAVPPAVAARPAAPQASRYTAKIASVQDRGPGVYLVTLEDGTAWEFAETVPLSYRSPVRGADVEIDRGALGGTRLRFDQQQAVRVRQVR